MKNLATVLALQTGDIILIAILALLAVIALVLLYFLWFRNYRLRKQAQELCATYEKHHAILEGQVAQYFSRLQRIAQLNLHYQEEASEWERKLRSFRENVDERAAQAAALLSEEWERHDARALRQDLPESRRLIAEHASGVNELYQALQKKLEREEECRALLVDARAALRDVKQSFYRQKEAMALLVPPFESVFRRLEDLLSECEEKVEGADYESAGETLRKEVHPVVDAIRKALPTLPSLSLEITRLLPEKLGNLEDLFRHMKAEDYALDGVAGERDIKELHERLDALRERLVALGFQGLQEDAEHLEGLVKEFQARLEGEIEARRKFEGGVESAHRREQLIAKEFISLSHSLQGVRSIYLLGQEEEDKINNIQNLVSQAAASRRVLDTCVHSVPRQPYGSLLERMEQLVAQEEEAEKALHDFHDYLASLKEDSERAARLLHEASVLLEESEWRVEALPLVPLREPLLKEDEEIHALLDELSALLRNPPIDVRKASALREEAERRARALHQKARELFDGERKCGARLLLANAWRSDSPEIENLLLQAEALYRKGEFPAAIALIEESQGKALFREGRGGPR